MKLLLLLATLGFSIVTASPRANHGFIEKTDHASKKDNEGLKVPGNSPFRYCKDSPTGDSFHIKALSMEPMKKKYEKNKNITIRATVDSDFTITNGTRMNVEIHWGIIKVPKGKNWEICKYVDCPTKHFEFVKELKIPKNAPDGGYTFKIKIEGPPGSETEGHGGEEGRDVLLDCMKGDIEID